MSAPHPAPSEGLPDRLRLPLAPDAAAMAAEALALPEAAWVPHFVPAHYSGSWSVLPLRAPADAVHPIMQIASPPDCTAWRETEWLARCPAIAAFLGTFASPLLSVRLMRLGPQSAIFEHRDHDLSADLGTARLHAPLTSSPEVRFEVNRQAVPMLPGECWYLRLADPHRVDNPGAATRIHLVIDAEVDGWLAALLRDAAAAADQTGQASRAQSRTA